MAPVDLVIRNATIITVDRDRRILENGAVAVDKTRIVKIGPSTELEALTARMEIDGRHRIVLPGLINPHAHISYSLGRGCGDDLPFLEWLPVVYRLEDAYTDDEWFLTSLLSMVEMIRSGTTCFADTNIYEEIGTVVRAVETSGIRAVLGKIIRDEDSDELRRNPALRGAWKRDHARSLSVAEAVDAYRRWNGKADGRIGVRLSPAVWPVCSEKSYREVAEAARNAGIAKIIHHTETIEWKNFVEREYGKAPTAMLEDFGVLGPDTLLENPAWLTEAEIEILASTSTPINYLPTSNLKNYLGVLDIPNILARGIQVSLGTSGGLINNVNDMFREMLVLALQQRMLRQQPDAIAPEAIVEMATIMGARTLNLDGEIGSLEEGKRADMIVLDGNQPHMVPIINPVSTVVYCAGGADVETVIIDGRVVMHERRFPGLDVEELLARSREASEAVRRRTGLTDHPQARPKWRYA